MTNLDKAVISSTATASNSESVDCFADENINREGCNEIRSEIMRNDYMMNLDYCDPLDKTQLSDQQVDDIINIDNSFNCEDVDQLNKLIKAGTSPEGITSAIKTYGLGPYRSLHLADSTTAAHENSLSFAAKLPADILGQLGIPGLILLGTVVTSIACVAARPWMRLFTQKAAVVTPDEALVPLTKLTIQ
jgi:hypothetical protein